MYFQIDQCSENGNNEERVGGVYAEGGQEEAVGQEGGQERVMGVEVQEGGRRQEWG